MVKFLKNDYLKPQFSLNFKKKLEVQIEALEKESTVEIVPVFVVKSSDYVDFRRFYSLAFMLVFLLIERFLPVGTGSIFSDWGIAIVISTALFFFWDYFPQYLLAAIPKEERLKRVQSAAQDAFLRHEVFATQKRSGILIYISFLEKSVVILADKGFTEHIPENVWQDLSQSLAQDFDAENPGHSFLKALDSFKGKFHSIFPQHHEDQNELPNKLRE